MLSAPARVDPAYCDATGAADHAHILGRDGWPLIGRTLAALRDLHAVATGTVRGWGEVSRLRLLGQGGPMVTGANHYQRIFQDADQIYSAEKGYDRQLGAFHPRGLLLMDFDEHCANRRLMQGAFKVVALQRYMEMMQPTIAAHVQAWGARRGFVFCPAIKHLLVEVGAMCFLGIEGFEHEAAKINASSSSSTPACWRCCASNRPSEPTASRNARGANPNAGASA